MKAKFNKSWNSSKQPRKQVKFRANAPNHIKRTLMGSTLDKKLREKYGRRSIEVKKGDEVKIMRGKFKGKQGKVGSVDIKNTRLTVDGVQRTKKGGEKLITWFNPSKVKIIVLDEKDSKRLNKSKRTEKKEVKEEKTEAKKAPAKEIKKTAPSGVPSAKGKEIKKETKK
ncbi:50S ribosomal protein L24 [Candidatus Pacearchaeota archaeon]|nr:50S ribosomal protein L24 [Candidatus Pacearchaeota archaeon]